MKQYSNGIAVLFITLLLALPTLAAADKVYTWTDENGVKHFGDMPPDRDDAEILEVDGVPRIGSESVVQNNAADGADEPTAAQLRREEIARNKVERKTAQAETQRLCDQARTQLQSIEPHRRVYYTDENGETVRMDDEERVGSVARLKEYLDANCK